MTGGKGLRFFDRLRMSGMRTHNGREEKVLCNDRREKGQSVKT
jgi:hypothetical protein